MATATRAIVHLDIDCFYIQCELLRRPNADPARPAAATQKFLVVTCNYPARAAGVTKLMRIDEAKQRCPELLLLPAEDLTPYREASESVFAVLCAFGPTQKLGLDEFFVDLTSAARESGESGWEPATHVHRAAHGTTTAEKLSKSGTNMRPMDLRAAAAPSALADGVDAPELLLAAATHVARRVKEAVRAETGLRTSVGVASNKLLAKLASGLHKPDGATCLPDAEAEAFVAPLPVRALPGVGSKMEAQLRALDVATVADVRRVAAHRLASAVGGAAATRLAALARGLDSDPLVPSGAPKSLSVMDSFKHADSHEQLRRCLAVLAPDLRRRLAADRRDHRRRATSMVVRWRHSTARTMNHPGGVATGAAVSRTLPMPAPPPGEEAPLASALEAAAAALLRRELPPDGGFGLTLLCLGASKFAPLGGLGALVGGSAASDSDAGPRDAGGPPDLSADAAANLERRADYRDPSAALLSKAEERMLREGGTLPAPRPSSREAAEAAGVSAWLARGAEAGSGGGASPAAPSPPQSADEWACAACTLLNPAAARTCSVCGALRGSTLPSSSQLALHAGGGGATSSGVKRQRTLAEAFGRRS